MYACAGGHEEVVKSLLEAGANVEDHENGHTPLMEAASAGHVGVAKVNSATYHCLDSGTKSRTVIQKFFNQKFYRQKLTSRT